MPVLFFGSISNRLLAATRQALGQGGLEVFSARIAGTVDERPHLLLGPIACADARCRVREMTEGFLDQRDFRIIATTVEQAPQSDHPDLRREFRLLGSKIPCGAHEGRGLGRVVPRAYEGDVEEPGVLRRGEPLATLTPRLDQVQQHLPSIPIGVALDRVAEDSKVGRTGGCLQSVAVVGVVGPTAS